MEVKEFTKKAGEALSPAVLIGITMVGIGASIFLDQYFGTAWLALIFLSLFGIALVLQGIRQRRMLYMIPGSLIAFLALGGFIVFSAITDSPWNLILGIALIAVGMGWFTIIFFTHYFGKHTAFWALIPGAVFAATGVSFAFTRMQLVDFVMLEATFLGMAFLIWGVCCKLFGLIIPGSLLLGIGPGVYYGWRNLVDVNGLAQTGVMLVWFALGWGLIILFSRVVTQKFVWWPLIPGGVFALVGWGLFIGGDPKSAVGFISNTGSVGLVIFGIYLLLMRRGIRK